MKATLVLLALVGTALAVPQNQQRIVGGDVTTIQQWPFMANLQFLNWGTTWAQSCGGSVINSRSIVTAAHCVIGDSANQWRTIVGTSVRAGSGGFIYTTNWIQMHNQYNNNNLDNDIALIRVAQTIGFTNTVQPVSIAGSNYNLADNQAVWAIGWGTTSSGGASSEQLRQVQVWSINQATCFARYQELPNFPNLTVRMLCAGWLDVGGRDACQGDSGGPLTHNNVLVGITSWGYGCAHARYPGVNARVSSFTTWIQANA